VNIHKVAVFGASARQGQAQVRQLLSHGYSTTAVTRHGHIFDGLEYRGLRVVAADYENAGELDQVFDAVDAVFFQTPNLGDPERIWRQCENVADACERSEIQRFILNSTMWAPAEPCGQPLYDLVLAKENMFAAKDIPLVVFRPVLFMDNLLTAWSKPTIINDGTYAYSQKPGLQMDYICLDDVARFMIEALRRPELKGERITIGGPQTLTPEEVAQLLSKVLGKSIRYEYIPPRLFGEKVFDVMGALSGFDRESYVQFFDAFYTFNNESPLQPFRCDMTNTLKRIPLKLTTMEDWARRQNWTLEGERIGSVSG
jgi:uncharacterized protein YbjT (DUF2867 family)